jgi:hypothetical protein
MSVARGAKTKTADMRQEIGDRRSEISDQDQIR